MEECSYCGESFEGEDAYLGHLADEHEGELRAIDQRRVEEYDGDDGGGVPTGPLVLGIVVGVAVLLVAYVTLFMGGGGGSGDGAPALGQAGSAHEHGTINVTVAGQTVDFTQPEYQVSETRNRRFHFERGTAIWHKHATGVTVQYALGTLGIDVTEDSVTFEGTTYQESEPGTEVVVEVNGEPVDPSQYVIQGTETASAADQGDHIRVVVRTNATGS